MGFEIPKRTATLDFEAYPGLEVVVNLDVKLGTFFDLTELADSGDLKTIKQALSDFGDNVLISWNAEEEGRAIPATAEGIMALPFQMAKDVLEGWMRGITELPAPLVEPSPNGTQYQEESGQTEPSSLRRLNTAG